MDKQIVVHPNNEILLNNKKEQNYWNTNNTNEFQKHYAKWQTPGTKFYILYDSIYHIHKKKGKISWSISASKELSILENTR